MPNDDTNAGLIVVGCLLGGLAVIFVAFLIVDSLRAEQGPPKWRHTHIRYSVAEVCDDQTCAPKGSFDE
jgi:hypothetical protein